LARGCRLEGVSDDRDHAPGDIELAKDALDARPRWNRCPPQAFSGGGRRCGGEVLANRSVPDPPIGADACSKPIVVPSTQSGRHGPFDAGLAGWLAGSAARRNISRANRLT
jgi:hypothetical protein